MPRVRHVRRTVCPVRSAANAQAQGEGGIQPVLVSKVGGHGVRTLERSAPHCRSRLGVAARAGTAPPPSTPSCRQASSVPQALLNSTGPVSCLGRRARLLPARPVLASGRSSWSPRRAPPSSPRPLSTSPCHRWVPTPARPYESCDAATCRGAWAARGVRRVLARAQDSALRAASWVLDFDKQWSKEPNFCL